MRASATSAASSATRSFPASPGATTTTSSSDTCWTPRPRLTFVAPRVVHEDATHDLRRHGKEVGAILPLHAGVVGQAHEGLVHQCGGLQAVGRALPTHVMAGEAVQFFVHLRRQRLQRPLVPLAPGAE
jgi:hypothetical protein